MRRWWRPRRRLCSLGCHTQQLATLHPRPAGRPPTSHGGAVWSQELEKDRCGSCPPARPPTGDARAWRRGGCAAPVPGCQHWCPLQPAWPTAKCVGSTQNSPRLCGSLGATARCDSCAPVPPTLCERPQLTSQPARSFPPAAEHFADRSDVQCLHRWQKVLNPEVHKGPWTPEEDEAIIRWAMRGVCRAGPAGWGLGASWAACRGRHPRCGGTLAGKPAC